MPTTRPEVVAGTSVPAVRARPRPQPSAVVLRGAPAADREGIDATGGAAVPVAAVARRRSARCTCWCLDEAG